MPCCCSHCDCIFLGLLHAECRLHQIQPAYHTLLHDCIFSLELHAVCKLHHVRPNYRILLHAGKLFLLSLLFLVETAKLLCHTFLQYQQHQLVSSCSCSWFWLAWSTKDIVYFCFSLYACVCARVKIV